MTTPHVISIQVGLPQAFGVKGASNSMDRPWTTGFFKTPIAGEIWLGSTNLVGDGQADLKNHGGVEKAVLAYAAEHYSAWQKDLQLSDFPYGAFGENLTIMDQTETSVCIGDIYNLGTAQIQISQPRQPCWKLSRRWRIRDLALKVQKNGRTGWYFRVLKEGNIEPNLPLILQERPYPQWTIARANEIMHHEPNNREDAAALAACPFLAPNWQQTLSRRANKSLNPDSASRLWGQN
ncbi:MAG: MOSC domain-containing protein [Xenococcus sp. (in: cyanobacteria)]